MLDIVKKIVEEFNEDLFLVLVVGDGNFSFSKDLSENCFLNSKAVHFYATSLDSLDTLEKCTSTIDQLEYLRSQQNVTLMHNVDATKLIQQFPDKKFHLIIFNFPHVGGKSNVKKCRLLLENFFSSSSEVLATRGKVVVSLCKGQGGIPSDWSRGAYGNTWQISTQASKSGFILTDVKKFDRSSLSCYSEAGYRGNVDKWFRTTEGLVYIFKYRCIEAINDDSVEFLPWFTVVLEKKYTKDIYKSLIHSISRSIKKYLEINDRKFDVDSVNQRYPCVGELDELLLLYDNIPVLRKTTIWGDDSIPSWFRRSPSVNKLHYVCWNPSAPIKPFVHAFNQRLILRILRNSEYCRGDLIDCMKNKLVKNLNISEQVFERAEGCKKISIFCSMNSSNTPQEINVDVVPYFIDDLPKSFVVKHTPEITWLKSDDLQSCKRIDINCYTLTELEESYLNKKTNDFGLCFSKAQNIELASIVEQHNEVFIELNLDHILLSCYQVNDLRYVYSDDDVFKIHLLAKINEDTSPEYDGSTKETLIKYPLCYRHDICFWLRAGNTEEEFLHEIRRHTHPYVHSVTLLKILRYEANNEISYCYRIIYSSVDSAFTHKQAVYMQNNLRKRLISIGYELR